MMNQRNDVLTPAFALEQLDFCKTKVDQLRSRFHDTFPGANTEGLRYP